MRSRIRPLFGASPIRAIALIALVALALGACATRASAHRGDEALAIHGQAVKVHRGGTAGPTIIFEPGLNESYYSFRDIQDELSAEARTFSYDRAAFKSIKDREGVTSLRQVRYLHELLRKAGERGPFLIVAHSVGGYNARLFAAEYPKEVAGIVFIDCSSESQPWSPSIAGGELTAAQLRASASLVRQANAKDALRAIPIIVLVADYANEVFPELAYWQGYQAELAGRSGRSRLVTVKDSGHQVQDEHPEVVIAAARELLAEVRRNGK